MGDQSWKANGDAIQKMEQQLFVDSDAIHKMGEQPVMGEQNLLANSDAIRNMKEQLNMGERKMKVHSSAILQMEKQPCSARCKTFTGWCFRRRTKGIGSTLRIPWRVNFEYQVTPPQVIGK